MEKKLIDYIYEALKFLNGHCPIDKLSLLLNISNDQIINVANTTTDIVIIDTNIDSKWVCLVRMDYISNNAFSKDTFSKQYSGELKTRLEKSHEKNEELRDNIQILKKLNIKKSKEIESIKSELNAETARADTLANRIDLALNLIDCYKSELGHLSSASDFDDLVTILNGKDGE